LIPYVRKWIKSLPHHPHEFAEPFAGGATVGISAVFENLVQKATLVELDPDVASVWKTILSLQGERLASRILSFELSTESVKAVLAQKPRNSFERAFRTIVRNRVQRGGIMAPGAGLVKRGENGRGLASRWYPATLERRILAIQSERHRISFIEGDGIEFMRENARRKGMVFFIDPPYTIAGRRLYLHSEINHEELFSLVSTLQGDFLMSYDNAPPIRDLAKKYKFETQQVAMKNTHHTVMSELLIGRNLGWVRGPVDLGENSLFEDLQTHRNTSGQAYNGILQSR
jgi:DNA adenine methylase